MGPEKFSFFLLEQRISFPSLSLQVRVPLGGRHQHKEANQVLGSEVHRLLDDVGAGPAG